MFKQMLNELCVRLEICPTGPLLIKDGRHQERGDKTKVFFHDGIQRNPARPRQRDGHGFGDYHNPDECFDMAFVYSRTATGKDCFYLPGSSLRGIFRTTAERLVGRWRPDLTLAGDPFTNVATKLVNRKREADDEYSSDAVYRAAGPLERCFGYTALRGRWTIPDAWMRNDQVARVIVRDGVGINRTTGAAEEHIKFAFEAITGGVFDAEIRLVNYELWQIGLLAHVMAALDGGEARLGYGTRRGLGRVRLRVTEMCWRWYSKQPDPPVGSPTRVSIPSLTELATAAKLTGQYDWHDAGITLTLPLERRQRLPVPEWVLSPSPNGPTNWSDSPWPEFGRLLPAALHNWPKLEEMPS